MWSRKYSLTSKPSTCRFLKIVFKKVVGEPSKVWIEFMVQKCSKSILKTKKNIAYEIYLFKDVNNLNFSWNYLNRIVNLDSFNWKFVENKNFIIINNFISGFLKNIK